MYNAFNILVLFVLVSFEDLCNIYVWTYSRKRLIFLLKTNHPDYDKIKKQYMQVQFNSIILQKIIQLFAILLYTFQYNGFIIFRINHIMVAYFMMFIMAQYVNYNIYKKIGKEGYFYIPSNDNDNDNNNYNENEYKSDLVSIIIASHISYVTVFMIMNELIYFKVENYIFLKLCILKIISNFQLSYYINIDKIDKIDKIVMNKSVPNTMNSMNNTMNYMNTMNNMTNTMNNMTNSMNNKIDNITNNLNIITDKHHKLKKKIKNE